MTGIELVVLVSKRTTVLPDVQNPVRSHPMHHIQQAFQRAQQLASPRHYRGYHLELPVGHDPAEVWRRCVYFAAAIAAEDIRR